MSHLLEVEGLCKKYGAITVADEVALNLDTGRCLGVIGPNGAGKTSLFGLVAGTIRPDRGVVRFAGQDVTALKDHRRARLGIVRAFQVPQPFPHLSVYENVLVAGSFGAGRSGAELEDLAAHALTLSGLIEKWALPAGRLPLLDRKRLELAKALATQAKVLLLDEIAAGLTEREVTQLTELIAALKTDHAVMWIEHIPHALKSVADEILVLHFGKAVLTGPPEAVMRSKFVREIYMGLSDDASA